MIDPSTLNAVKPEIDRMISTAEAHIAFIVDVMKHLTTVATGVTVLIAAFHEKFAAAAHFRWAIPISIVCLLTCIVYAVKICMIGLRHGTRLLTLRKRLFLLSVRALGIGAKVTNGKPGMNIEADELFGTEAMKDDRAIAVAFSIANWACFVGICAVAAFIVSNTH
jgi:hypothetical protein